MIRVIRDKAKEELFFFVALSAAIATSFFSRPRLGAIDWHVILSLSVLMGLTLVFEKYALLDAMARRLVHLARTKRQLSLVLIALTALLGMVITNDVALLMMVPLTLLIARKLELSPLKWVVAQTLAANIGSSLTPFGNPQNLYLFNYYKIATTEFFLVTGLFVFVGLSYAIGFALLGPNPVLKPLTTRSHSHWRKRLWLFIGLFLLTIAAILRWLPFYPVLLLTSLALLGFEYKLMKRLDFFLLGTFMACFIAIDNLTRISLVTQTLSGLLNTPLTTYLTAVASSQVISNVPAAILLSGFTQHDRALLLGVSTGGLGTMIASLANLISYKLYVRHYQAKAYKKAFYLSNLLGLMILVPLCLVLLAWL